MAGPMAAQLRNALWRLEEVQTQQRALAELEAVLVREINMLQEKCGKGCSGLGNIAEASEGEDNDKGEDAPRYESCFEDAPRYESCFEEASLAPSSSDGSDDSFVDRPPSLLNAATAARGGCFEVVRKYAALPVTLYCGQDSISLEVQHILDDQLARWPFIRFEVHEVCAEEVEHTVDDFLNEQVVVICLRYDGESDEVFARCLSKKLRELKKRFNGARLAPAAMACFVWGYDEMPSANCRMKGSLSIASALEGLGSTPLPCNHVRGVEPRDDLAAARLWAVQVAHQLESFACGSWAPVPDGVSSIRRVDSSLPDKNGAQTLTTCTRPAGWWRRWLG